MPESAHQTRQTQRRRRRVSAFAVVALLGLSALAFSAWSLSASKTADGSALSLDQTATAGTGSSAPAGNAPATTPATTRVVPEPVGPVALKPGSTSQVAAWNAGPGGTTLAAITARLGTVLMAHDARRYVQMRQECAGLAAEVRSAGAESAIPDSAMEKLYSKALASLAAGAANCQAAVSSRQQGDEDLITKANPALLATAMSELTAGTRDLYIATAGIKALKTP